MADTNAERQARWRQRRQDGVQREPCPGCGRHGAWGEHAPWHRGCWRLSPAGLEWDRLRIQTRRQQQIVTTGEQSTKAIAQP